MKEAIDAVEDTSEYVKGEIARKKAIYNKDVAELIGDEHDAYRQKVLDCALAYDDLALGGERDLEKVRQCSHSCFCPHLITVTIARYFNISRDKHFPGGNITAVLPARRDSIAGETGRGRSQ